MRAQCCICADLFESSAQVPISATPCGHTFHEACLLRWLENSSTCPSCRTSVKKNKTQRLFFDISEDTTGEGDLEQLLNQAGTLKAQVQEKERAKQEIAESRDRLAVQLADSNCTVKQLEKALDKERLAKEVLQRDAALQRKENDVYRKAMEDYKKVKEKLQSLENVEIMLQGTESDVQEVLNQYSDGGSMKDLCTLVTVMKREFKQAAASLKILREENSKLKNSLGQHRGEVRDLKHQLSVVRSQLEETSDTLCQIEKENLVNRRKVCHLRKALRDNKEEGSESFHRAINEDSPNVAFTPVRGHIDDLDNKEGLAGVTPRPSLVRRHQSSSPETSQQTKEFSSPDLFDKSDTSPHSPRLTSPEICPSPLTSHISQSRDRSEPILKLVDIPTAAERIQAASKAKKSTESKEEDEIKVPQFLSIMQKKMTGLSNARSHIPSVITRGYDGLGGSTTFVQPLGPPKASLGLNFAKKAKRPASRTALWLQGASSKQQRLADCMRKAVPTSSYSKANSSSQSSQASSGSHSSQEVNNVSDDESENGSSSSSITNIQTSKRLGSSFSSTSSKPTPREPLMNAFKKLKTASTNKKKYVPPSSSSSTSSSLFPRLSADDSQSDFIDLT